MQGKRRLELYALPATGCQAMPGGVAVPVGVLTIAASAPFPGEKPGGGVVFWVRGFSRGFSRSLVPSQRRSAGDAGADACFRNPLPIFRSGPAHICSSIPQSPGNVTLCP